MRKTTLILCTALLATSLWACKHDPEPEPTPAPGVDEETYAGGLLGTTFNQSASAYEDPTPAVEQAGMVNAFKYGEFFFEHTVTQNNPPFNGLGPVYVRSSCESCHPGYGHGRRMNRYRADDWANGYLLVVYDKTTNAYEKSVAGMPQTKAVAPFKAPIDEEKITIDWLTYTDEWGNRFPDGETYSLIYPEVTIPLSAFYVPLQVGGKDIDYSQLRVRLESTIGLYGTGLLDAIDENDIRAQYEAEQAAGVTLNPAIWNGSDFNYYTNTTQGDGTKYVRRYTYALSRANLQDGAGANAIWNITNVTRSDRRYHYMTAAYATVASNDPEVQADFYKYFPKQNVTGNVKTDIYNYLMSKTLDVEMTDQEYIDLMAWHRGLAVPAARNINDPDFLRGKELFSEIGCAYCQRPSWTTGDDIIRDPNNFFVGSYAEMLPRYPHQTIWPYTDLIQHRMYMVNDIRTGWCRTTPLWGRGLSRKCTGADDRLHDCRARTVIEAIMWHGNVKSDARRSVERFRELSKADRDAIVTFIESI